MSKIYHNLDIDWKSGNFYQYSKDEKTGFEPYTSNTGNTSYRKYYKAGVYGILESIKVEDTPLGKKLSLRMMDGDNIFIAKVPLYDQRGNIDNNFAEPLIALLPNLEKKQAYRLFPWIMEDEERKTKSGNPRKIYGFSIKKADLDKKEVLNGDDAKVEPKYLRRKKEEEFKEGVHIPDLDFEEEFGSYKPTAVSLDARRKFLINVLQKEEDRLGYNGNNSNNTPANDNSDKVAEKKEPKAEEKNVEQPVFEVEDDYDDLPF
jgi:hypothetical protein